MRDCVAIARTFGKRAAQVHLVGVVHAVGDGLGIVLTRLTTGAGLTAGRSACPARAGATVRLWHRRPAAATAATAAGLASRRYGDSTALSRR